MSRGTFAAFWNVCHTVSDRYNNLARDRYNNLARSSTSITLVPGCTPQIVCAGGREGEERGG